MDLNFALESSESHYRGSFSRGIRIFGSQDVIRGSKPNLLGKTYPRKKVCFFIFQAALLHTLWINNNIIKTNKASTIWIWTDLQGSFCPL